VIQKLEQRDRNHIVNSEFSSSILRTKSFAIKLIKYNRENQIILIDSLDYCIRVIKQNTY